MRILHVGFGFRPWRNGGLIEYVEDLLAAQAAAGHTVAYFCSGRHYPFRNGPRLRHWKRDGVRVFEVINSPIAHGADAGTRRPFLELEEPGTEALFRRVLTRFAPDVVHIQEIAGLPSSLIDITKNASVPVLMTLQDYFMLCPTLKLYDHAGATCRRASVDADCRRCCATAGDNQRLWTDITLRYEWQRVKDAVPRPIATVLKKCCGQSTGVGKAAAPAVSTSYTLALHDSSDVPHGAYQTRRSRNLERLRSVDLLIAQSHGVERIYRDAGAANGNIRTIHLTLQHLEALTPTFRGARNVLTFVTLNGCYSVPKGATILLEAMERLHQEGLSERCRLVSAGGLHPQLRQRFLQLPNFESRGWYKPSQLSELLEVADVGIIPSVWEEAFGYVGLEFLAKGIPIIGNAAGGIPDYTIDGETGWLNHGRTADELCSIIRQLIEHPELVQAMRQKVITNRGALIKSMGHHVQELDVVYKQLVG